MMNATVPIPKVPKEPTVLCNLFQEEPNCSYVGCSWDSNQEPPCFPVDLCNEHLTDTDCLAYGCGWDQDQDPPCYSVPCSTHMTPIDCAKSSECVWDFIGGCQYAWEPEKQCEDYSDTDCSDHLLCEYNDSCNSCYLRGQTCDCLRFSEDDCPCVWDEICGLCQESSVTPCLCSDIADKWKCKGDKCVWNDIVGCVELDSVAPTCSDFSNAVECNFQTNDQCFWDESCGKCYMHGTPRCRECHEYSKDNCLEDSNRCEWANDFCGCRPIDEPYRCGDMAYLTIPILICISLCFVALVSMSTYMFISMGKDKM